VQQVTALIGCGDNRDAGLPKLVGIDGRSNLVGASQLRGTTQHTTFSIHGMQHPTMQHVVCNFQRAACTDAHAARNIRQTTCNSPRAKGHVQHTTWQVAFSFAMHSTIVPLIDAEYKFTKEIFGVGTKT
jgi:hypothetical protein